MTALPTSLPQVVVRAVPIGSDAAAWPDAVLGHGETPGAAAERAVREGGGPPVVVVRPRAVDLVGEVLVVELEVRPGTPARAPVAGAAAPDAVLHRRLGAYAVVLDDDRVLMTQFGGDTPSPGTWGLPGGGVDPGEPPAEGVVREVLEETAHVLVDTRLLHVDSTHFTWRSPSGRMEDFHGIGVIYLAGVNEVFTPRVLDVGGSTSAAAWVSLDRLPALAMSPRTRERLTDTLALALGRTVQL